MRFSCVSQQDGAHQHLVENASAFLIAAAVEARALIHSRLKNATIQTQLPMSRFLSAFAIFTLGACGTEPAENSSVTASVSQLAKSCAEPTIRPVKLPAGEFVFGQDGIYPEEGPERLISVGSFWIDAHEVTNGEFAEFVAATGYVTTAEKPADPKQFGVPQEQIAPELLLPGSAVFTPPDTPSPRFSDWWQYVPGASWMKPYGPTGPDADQDEPVVHLAWQDMQEYADWKGGRIPTEVEWEYAAKAGSGNYVEQPSPEHANSWQGIFPLRNLESDGFKGIAPVACFEPNEFGLYDMVGNVWEVTASFYRPGHDRAAIDGKRGPSENSIYDDLNTQSASRVMKGGSFLCAPNYCQRYRPASRHASDPGLGTSNVGFRLAYDVEPKI